MNVDDIFLILHHYWVQDTMIFPDGCQRLQVAFLVLISAYTATRPGGLVYVPRNVKECKRSSIEVEDDEEDNNNNYDSNNDNDKDEDKGMEVDESGEEDDFEGNDSKDNSNDDNEIKGDDSNMGETKEDSIVNALLANPNCNDLVKTLCYKDVNLMLLPNPTGTQDLLALEINLRYTKGHQRQAKR
jgi:hypothetical protein